MAEALAASTRPEDVLELSLRRYAPSTLQNYLRHIALFLDYLSTAELSLDALTLSNITDYLLACAASTDEDRSANRVGPRPMLKAISWLQRQAQIPALGPLLMNPLVQAFHALIGPADRREAMPIPLALIAAWERGVCAPHTPAAVKLFLGGLLLAAHASLRFGDLQRIEVTNLSLAATALRGSCWTTKTTKQGQPFAVTITGFTGRDIATAWTIHWLTAVAHSLDATETIYGEAHRLDFVLPAFSPSLLQQPPVYATPLAYGQALASIRWAAQTPWLPTPCLTAPEASNLTLHSLKVTMLSAALQLRLPEDDRRVQGHHRLNSTNLYGRDDTHQALWVRRRLSEALSKLWRPQRPMARGGQQPMAEPPFQVPADPPPAGISLAALPPALERFIYTREKDQQQEAHETDPGKESDTDPASSPSEGQASEGDPLASQPAVAAADTLDTHDLQDDPVDNASAHANGRGDGPDHTGQCLPPGSTALVGLRPRGMAWPARGQTNAPCRRSACAFARRLLA